MTNSSAVLWTGGKDSSLASYEGKLLGYEAGSLVTFVLRGVEFRTHPLGFMRYQADALGIPHYTMEVTEPFEEGYKKAIRSLKEKHGVNTLITGDIAEVRGYPNWI